MHILAIETSCDETSAAIIESSPDDFKLRSSIVSSQVKLHAEWGGVVPNLAAREHLKNITPVVKKALSEAHLSEKDIDLIAVTAGPGLIPALLIGVEAAKVLSYLWQVPLIGVHHIEGHIYANFIPESKSNEIKFPLLCLVVSGGHTQLILMKKHLQYEIIGETLDDAAGEAFDKVARILDLGYPGGPVLSKIAEKDSSLNITLPRPMKNSGDFNFSFSGLKTAVLYLAKKNEEKLKDKKFVAALAAEFQDAVVDVLTSKTLAAAEKHKAKTVMLAGGVSANQALREKLGETISENLPSATYIIPEIKYTGDNAAMIGAAAHFRFHKKPQKRIWKNNWKDLEAKANLKL